MTVLLKTGFEKCRIVDLKLTKGVLRTVLQGDFECYELKPGVIVVYNPKGKQMGMPLSCGCREKGLFFFGPVLITGKDPKNGLLTNTPMWVIDKLRGSGKVDF